VSGPTTWRQALRDAHEGVAQAKETRRRVFEAAHEAGLSMRAISGAVGLSAATVHRIIGLEPEPDAEDLLDSPVREPPP
jgi:transposase